MWVPELSPAVSPCTHLPCSELLGLSDGSCDGGGRGRGLSLLSLPAPSPTPQVPFSPYCSGCLSREAPQHHVLWGLSRPGFPTAWSCFSPGHHCLLPLALAMSLIAWCPGRSLCGEMTQE